MLLNAGNGNYVNASRILTVSRVEAASIKRAMNEAKEAGLLLDFTGQDKTRSVILMDSGIMIRCSLRSSDIQRNMNELQNSN